MTTTDVGTKRRRAVRGRAEGADATGTFALLIPDFHNPVYAAIIDGAEGAAARSGALLLTGRQDRERVTSYIELLRQDRVDGLLIAGVEATAADQISQLESVALPWLLLNRRTTRARRYVILDDEAAARTAVEHLIELGHEHIAHIAGPRSADTAERRHRGFVVALQTAGLKLRDGYIVRSDYSTVGGAKAAQELLRLRHRPTGVVVANAAMAIGLLFELGRAGVMVPEDMSIVGLHDLPLADYLEPPLTTVKMPLEQLGRRGIELISSVDPGDPIEEVVEGPVELVERDSTAPPPG